MILSELKTTFTGLMNNRLLTANASLQQTFIDQAVLRIQREVRIPAMEKSVNVTIDGATYAGLVIPSDLLELIQIVPATSLTKLRKCDISRALNLAQYTGTPTEYCRQGGLWVLGNKPADGDVIRVDYYAELTALDDPTDENVVSIIAWDLIVNAALVQSCIFYKDKRAVDFETQYQTIKKALEDQAETDDTSGGSEVMPAYSFPEDGCW